MKKIEFIESYLVPEDGGDYQWNDNHGRLIRCKDCGHWDTTWQNDFAPNYHYCPLVDGTRRDDFYCADAELRGGKK